MRRLVSLALPLFLMIGTTNTHAARKTTRKATVKPSAGLVAWPDASGKSMAAHHDSSAAPGADSLALLRSSFQNRLAASDSLIANLNRRDSSRRRELDSANKVIAAQQQQLTAHRDSLRALDSLRQSAKPDTGIVLFFPVDYDTLHHAYDSSLATELTQTLRGSLIQAGRYQVWEPAAEERGIRTFEAQRDIALRKGAGQILTGGLSYSRDTLIYTATMTAVASGVAVHQSQVVGYHRESKPVKRFSRIAAGQLFGISQEQDPHEARPESPLWRRVLLLTIFGIFAGTVVGLSW